MIFLAGEGQPVLTPSFMCEPATCRWLAGAVSVNRFVQPSVQDNGILQLNLTASRFLPTAHLSRIHDTAGCGKQP